MIRNRETAGGRAIRSARRRCPGERGMVTAELAIALPGIVVVALVLAWLLSLGLTQAGLAQAAREGARAAARGEPVVQVRQVVQRLAPGARVTVRSRGAQVEVTAAVRREPPLRLLRPLGRGQQASATSWWEGR